MSEWSETLDAILVLEDGTFFLGRAFGAREMSVGEVVFNTSMSGYQEILTDPSYSGQLVTMTSPHIGNYGVNAHDVESTRIWARGLIVRSVTEVPSNWRSEQSLPDWLSSQGISAISEVDTRALTRHIRDKGVMKAVIAPDCSEQDVPRLLEVLASAPDYGEEDFVEQAMVDAITSASSDSRDVLHDEHLVMGDALADHDEDERPHAVILDFGLKHSIPRLLAARGCRVTIAPGTSSAKEIAALRPDGVLLSNGPGDPARLDALVETLKGVMTAQPTFGICLGHQVLARAAGASTFKLRFGHRGPNQPVQELSSGKVAMTSQNHGFAVSSKDLPDALEVTHINLNDETVAGFKHRELPIVAVQYHPEAGPGPHDAEDFFDDFLVAIRTHIEDRAGARNRTQSP